SRHHCDALRGSSMSVYLNNLTYRTRIRAALILLIVFVVTITGWGAYWIASDIVESHAIQSGEDALNRSIQVLDNDLRRIAISVMTLMISDAFKELMRDVSLMDDSRYASHMTTLQTLFAQMKQIEP